jgi:hypothetical protein
MSETNGPSTPIRFFVWTILLAASFSLAAALIAGDRSSTGLVVADPGSGGATSLTLAPNLSFTDDSSINFPIRGENLQDGAIASDRPTIIFFGTSHCWNTNREAERFVALYAKERDSVRFLVIDVEHASTAQRPLVSRFYHGSIPTLAVLDRSGKVVYNEAGETSGRRADTSKLEEILGKAR